MKGLGYDTYDHPCLAGTSQPGSYVAYSFLENGSYATQPNPPLAPDSRFIIAVDLILRTNTADSPYQAVIGTGVIFGRYNMIGSHLTLVVLSDHACT